MEYGRQVSSSQAEAHEIEPTVRRRGSAHVKNRSHHIKTKLLYDWHGWCRMLLLSYLAIAIIMAGSVHHGQSKKEMEFRRQWLLEPP